MLRLYMNHNVERAVTQGVRLRGVDVVSAYEDAAHRLSDPELLDRATALERVLFSTDSDLIVEAHRRQSTGEPFGGVIFARQGKLGIGAQIDQLELIAKASTPDELRGTLLFLWHD